MERIDEVRMKEKTIIEQLIKKIREEELKTGKRTTYHNFIVIILAVLGGCSVLIEMTYPILLVFIWVKIFGFTGFGSYLFYLVGFLASVFNAIKIGWLK